MKDRPSHRMTSGLTCHDVTEHASDYLDDRLPTMNKVRVGLHLVSCANCSAYVKQIALVRDAVAMLPKRLPPPITLLRLRRHFSFCHAMLQ